MAIMILAVELEDDQETPNAGSLGDWSNKEWNFLDVAVAITVPGDVINGPTLTLTVTEAINRALGEDESEYTLADDPQNPHNEVPHFEKPE